jgi:hypothetical protein
MKKFTILFFSIYFSCALYAQQQANHSADRVPGEDIGMIPTNPRTFTKDKRANYLLRSDRMNVGFWINPEKWSFNKAVYDNKAEYELQLKGHHLYATVMTDTVQIPYSEIIHTEMNEISAVAPNARVITKEFRKVNGLRVLCLFLNGTVNGKEISFYGYYYSDPEGTVQFLAYTSEKQMRHDQKSCKRLLNGIVTTKSTDPELHYHKNIEPMLISHF